MPSPVSFQISLAPFPATFAGTPAQWAEAVRARLSVTPAEPWSSFQNGGAIGASDVGPVLYGGIEWRVFDPALGAYTYHKQNGAGLVDQTVTTAKLAGGLANGVLLYDGAGRPFVGAPGTNGQLLTMVAGAPAWAAPANAPGANYFEATLNADQNFNTDSNFYTVNFDTVVFQNGVTFDTTNKRIPLGNNEVWFLYCGLQFEEVGAASTNVEIELRIRKNGGVVGPGGTINFDAVPGRLGMYYGGVVLMSGGAGYYDVAAWATEAVPASPGLKISADGNTTRFGGFRIF